MAEVKINEHGFAFVRIHITCSNSTVPKRVRFKVDTGANRNTIDRAWLRVCGYDDAWVEQTGRLLVGSERPSVATNVRVDDCYEIVLPEIRLGLWTGRNWPFLVRLKAKDDEQFRHLFGTDSLRFFKWEFDYVQGVCRYEGITGKKMVTFNQAEQTLHSVDSVLSGSVPPNGYNSLDLTAEESQLLQYIKIQGGIERHAEYTSTNVWTSCSDFKIDPKVLKKLVDAKQLATDGCKFWPI